MWDKSGEPDPQVRQLEEILGTLRYQPKPLEMPRDLPVPRRRSYFPLLAIAATVLIALVAGGLWFKARRVSKVEPQQARVAPVVEEKPIAPAPVEQPAPRKSESIVATNNRRRPKSSAPVLTRREREEALAAKQQLMLALRLASEKLNLAHKKTQSPNQIKNQHRVG